MDAVRDIAWTSGTGGRRTLSPEGSTGVGR